MTKPESLIPDNLVPAVNCTFFLPLPGLSTSANITDPQRWVSNYADELYGYAFSKTGDSALAEDLVQETFLAALNTVSQFRGDSSERTWLYSILKFRIAGHYRKASTRHEMRLTEQGQDLADHFFVEDGAWRPESRPKEWALDHSSVLENRELAQALERCIERLNESQKKLVVLKMIEETEVTRICKELQITATNYWVIIHRAKLQLRACLEKNWLNLP